MRHFLFIILATALLWSCKEQEQRDTRVVSIDLPSSAVDARDFSETGDKYVKSVKYVGLETSDEMLIREISKILIAEERIYILDARLNEVFIYDRDGRAVNKISRIGQGPEEYYNITGMFYDEETQTFNLLCRYKDKIMVFDKDGVSLLRQIELPVALYDLKKGRDGGYIGQTSSAFSVHPFSIYYFSDDFSQIQSDFPNHPGWQTNRHDNTLSVHNDTIYFAPLHGYSVYKINNRSIEVAYQYDFGACGVTDEMFKNRDLYDNIDLRRHVDRIGRFQETDEYLISEFLYHGTEFLSFYDKNSKGSEVFRLVNNPLYYGSFGSFVDMNDRYIISQLSANSVLACFENPDFIKKGAETIAKIKEDIQPLVSGEGNPILCIYSLRQ